VIFGYTYPDLPLQPAIDAFEALAAHAVDLGPRYQEIFARTRPEPSPELLLMVG
jgi:hypothetical protein